MHKTFYRVKWIDIRTFSFVQKIHETSCILNIENSALEFLHSALREVSIED